MSAITKFKDRTAAIAKQFSDNVLAAIGKDKFNEVRERNATPRYMESTTSICASHDFCDANLPMAEAFKKVVGRESNADSFADAALWNASWDLAKRLYLTDQHGAHIEFFKAHGFTYEYPGYFYSDVDKDTYLTCAFDWSGTGLWEIQWQINDGGGSADEDSCLDFASVEEVVMVRDLLVLSSK